jgi:hypothetical protein
MKLRLQKKRPDLGRREDFYIDEANYPDTGFLPMTLGERQRVLLNIIQSNPVNESLMVDSSTASGQKAKDPFVAGISIALYRKYKVRAPGALPSHSRHRPHHRPVRRSACAKVKHQANVCCTDTCDISPGAPRLQRAA